MDQFNTENYIILWHEVRNHKKIEDKLFYTIHKDKRDAYSTMCKYLKAIPDPEPDLFYKPAGESKNMQVDLIPQDQILQLNK